LFATRDNVTPSPQTVSARLREAVAAGRLEFDAAQHEAAARLDALSGRLRSKPRGLLKALSARKAAERGLYLWGGVGRGKTLLMDMFFASLELPQAQRCHFYRFMRGVHAELGGIIGQTQPLEVVAQRIARRAQIVCLDEFLVADIADAMILGGLLDGLFRRGVTLVATSTLRRRICTRTGCSASASCPPSSSFNPMSKSCTWTAASTIGCASSSRRQPTWTPNCRPRLPLSRRASPRSPAAARRGP